jgi:hypothetical protein
MKKTNLLSAALMIAALLITPAIAQQGKLTSHRRVANALTTYRTDEQTCCRDRGSDLHGLPERDVWGHWGAYYGPTAVAP